MRQWPPKTFRLGKRPVVVQKVAKTRGTFGLDRELRTVVDRVELQLPRPPSVNGLYFNREDGGRAKTPQYDEWLVEAGWRLQQQRPGRIDGAYEIEIRVARPDKRRRDLGNLEKALSDLLVRHKVILDDCLSERITLCWSGGGDDVVVTVSKHSKDS